MRMKWRMAMIFVLWCLYFDNVTFTSHRFCIHKFIIQSKKHSTYFPSPLFLSSLHKNKMHLPFLLYFTAESGIKKLNLFR